MHAMCCSGQVPHTCTQTSKPGPQGESWVWWQCTVKGGREGRPLGAVELARAVEALGAGEILLNCIDTDGAKQVRPRWCRSQGWGPVLLC